MFLNPLYPIGAPMVKLLKKRIPLFCLILANIAIVIKNGFDWLNTLALLLAVAVLIWDILEVILDGRS